MHWGHENEVTCMVYYYFTTHVICDLFCEKLKTKHILAELSEPHLVVSTSALYYIYRRRLSSTCDHLLFHAHAFNAGLVPRFTDVSRSQIYRRVSFPGLHLSKMLLALCYRCIFHPSFLENLSLLLAWLLSTELPGRPHELSPMPGSYLL